MSKWGNYLVFLMRVGKAFSSHRELWQYLPKRVREKKSATDNVHGELYEPLIKHDGNFDRAKDCDPKRSNTSKTL